MLWRLRAGMPCNNKPKFTINNVSQWPPPLAAGSCGSGAHVGKELAPGTWQHGWSKGNPLAAGYHCYEPLVLRQILFLILVPPQKCCRSLLCYCSHCWKQKAWTLAGLLGHLHEFSSFWRPVSSAAASAGAVSTVTFFPGVQLCRSQLRVHFVHLVHRTK